MYILHTCAHIHTITPTHKRPSTSTHTIPPRHNSSPSSLCIPKSTLHNNSAGDSRANVHNSHTNILGQVSWQFVKSFSHPLSNSGREDSQKTCSKGARGRSFAENTQMAARRAESTFPRAGLLCFLFCDGCCVCWRLICVHVCVWTCHVCVFVFVCACVLVCTKGRMSISLPMSSAECTYSRI